MAEEVQNLWVGGFNPSLYKLLVNSFENKEFKTEVTLNQSEGMRIDFIKQKDVEHAEIMVNCSCWDDIKDCDVEAYVKKNLGDVIRPCTKLHVNLYLEVPKAEYEKEGDSYLKKVASVHEYILAAPFYKYLKALQDGSLSSLYPKILSFYLHEPIYIIPKSTSVSIVFSINETDDTDRSLMQVFLLEFSEAKRTVVGSPSVTFSRDEPNDIHGMVKEKPSVGFLSFAFNEENVAGNRAEKAAALLSSFRFYLDYHVKSSKTFLHGRMRNRAEQWKNCRLWEQCGL
ncbi:uncharacterized protein [Blastocystis hominis]|uniref:Arp2/3 complex 34 kDa subunit n=1 Tax=Blastocystis hominis TaxID=12968 RepID=D8M8Z4_BLAHO|nr:uncharacterized protein [Blastocystis hominis]CBK24533.2 unnamed protein product [Blastocystis hominis]|eukprot:XP_012898581.1 uncharacterized protein [Blastocystis hominis]